MKSTNNMHRKTAKVVTTKTGKPTTSKDPSNTSGRSIPGTHTTSNRSSNSNLGAIAPDHLPRHTSTLYASTSESEPSSNSNSITIARTKYFGLFRKRIHRLFSLDSTATTETKAPLPQISPSEPYLYLCPDGLHRYYRPLPSIIKVLTVCMATWMSFGSTNLMKKQLSAVSLFRQITVRLFKLLAYALFVQVVLQDTLFANKRPSRVTMDILLQKYFLPSSLSKYETITVEPPQAKMIANQNTNPNATTTIENEDKEPSTLGVHYLQYDNTNENTTDKDDEDENENSSASTESNTSNNDNIKKKKKKKRSFAAIYFQHGFGASSLSWLPVLPKLAKQMNAKVALGHDTVGFGFTERPQNARWYRPKQMAKVAETILAKESQAATSSAHTIGGNSNNESSRKHISDSIAHAPVCLFGHSMGSRATLRLATQLPAETPKLIVLSSPALGLIAPKLSRKTEPSSAAFNRRIVSSLKAVISRKVIQPSLQYVLRRIIGTKGSWRKGLEGAWGDPKTVTEDSDVLRYSWPSIGYGWEEGILKFAGAQVLQSDDELDDDFLLMGRVLELPRTKVLIILGSKDMVIPTRSVKRFLEKVAATSKGSSSSNDIATNVPIVELEGLGHCAFEEDPEVFCNALEELVKENWDCNAK